MLPHALVSRWTWRGWPLTQHLFEVHFFTPHSGTLWVSAMPALFRTTLPPFFLTTVAITFSRKAPHTLQVLLVLYSSIGDTRAPWSANRFRRRSCPTFWYPKPIEQSALPQAIRAREGSFAALLLGPVHGMCLRPASWWTILSSTLRRGSCKKGSVVGGGRCVRVLLGVEHSAL